MKNILSNYFTKVQKFFKRKTVVKRLKDDYNSSTIQSITDDKLIQIWNKGFPDEAVDIYENGQLTITDEKFYEDIQSFAKIIMLMIFGVAMLMLINFYNK